MKNILAQGCRRFSFLIASFLLSIVAFAQDKGLDVDINVKKESQWYQQPWVWAVGAAVFILLLVAILRSGKSSSTS